MRRRIVRDPAGSRLVTTGFHTAESVTALSRELLGMTHLGFSLSFFSLSSLPDAAASQIQFYIN